MNFRGELKILAAEKAINNYYNFCTKSNVFSKYLGIMSSINMKMGQNQIKLTSSKYDLIGEYHLEPVLCPLSISTDTVIK